MFEFVGWGDGDYFFWDGDWVFFGGEVVKDEDLVGEYFWVLVLEVFEVLVEGLDVGFFYCLVVGVGVVFVED